MTDIVEPSECENSHEKYRIHLQEFSKYLNEDWKRWAIMQIKQSMLQGRRTIYLFGLKKNDWKHGKTVLNFWKKKFVSDKEIKYYNSKTNVFITNKWLRSVIDFLEDIGLGWRPVSTQNTETITLNYNQIHGEIHYPSKLIL